MSADVGEGGVAQAGDVVYDRGSRVDRGGGDGRLAGVDRDGRPELAGDPLDERDDALELFLDGYGRNIGAG